MQEGSYIHRHELRKLVTEISLYKPVDDIWVRGLFGVGKQRSVREVWVPDDPEHLKAHQVHIEKLPPHEAGRDKEIQVDHAFSIKCADSPGEINQSDPVVEPVCLVARDEEQLER